MTKILHYFTSFKKELIIGSCLICVSTAIAAFLPYFEGQLIINTIFELSSGEKDIFYFPLIFPFIFCNLLFYIIITILRFIYNQFLIVSIHNGIKELRYDMHKKIHRLPIEYFERNTLGNIMSRMTNDIEIISNSLQQACSSLIYSFFFLFFSSAWMFWIHWQLGLLVFLIIPLSFFTIYKIASKSQNIFIQRFESFGSYNGFLQEQYTGHKEILLYNQQSNVIDKLKEKNKNLSNLIFKSNFLSGLLVPIIKTFTYLMLALVSILGFLLMHKEDPFLPKYIVAIFGVTIKLGIFQAFIKYVWCLENPISELTQMSFLLQSAQAASHRVIIFLHEKEEQENFSESKRPIFLDSLKSHIIFQDVHFSFGSKKILQNVNFKIECGKMVAIVGPTGSGKSTLINLLMRFYSVNQGQILIDGFNINDLCKDNLRQILGMVLQDTWLFGGTIFDNIKYGNHQATDTEVLLAAKQANVDLFIHHKTKGYGTIISEESDNLSQGEKQMITIARTILRNPSVLILDEATATIDTRTEFILQKAIQKLLINRTSFVIAHRLSTIRNADQILFLKDGQIVESGNHQELLKIRGFYFKLYQSQFK